MDEGHQGQFEQVMPALTTLVDDHIIDPRREHGQRHCLIDIVAIALVATLCGAEGYDEISDWGQANADWLGPWLSLKHGVPDESCFRRVLSAIDPDDMIDLVEAVTQVLARSEDEQVCIDGKAIRGSRRHDEQALMLLNAWGSEQRLVLAQQVIEPEQNEISALPNLLDTLDLEGAVVTIDAVNTQVSATERLREAGADFVLPVKDNQPTLHEELKEFFSWQFDDSLALESRLQLHFDEQVDGGHGRVETRQLWCYQGPQLDDLSRLHDFRDARTVICLRRERDLGDKTQCETRYFITSLPATSAADARRLNDVIRNHWGVENSAHWVLDVTLSEDACRVANKRAAANLAIIRRMALNLLRHEPSAGKRVSIKRRRWWCCIDRQYLMAVLAQALVPGVHDR